MKFPELFGGSPFVTRTRLVKANNVAIDKIWNTIKVYLRQFKCHLIYLMTGALHASHIAFVLTDILHYWLLISWKHHRHIGRSSAYNLWKLSTNIEIYCGSVLASHSLSKNLSLFPWCIFKREFSIESSSVTNTE